MKLTFVINWTNVVSRLEEQSNSARQWLIEIYFHERTDYVLV